MTQHRRRAVRMGMVAASTLALGALVLTGCSGTATPEESGDSEAFSLAYAVSNDVESPFAVLAEQYMDANPNVEITLNPIPNDSYGQTVATQLQAGNASDVISTAPGIGQQFSLLTLAEGGFIDPIEGAEDVIPAGNESLFEYDGGVYGVALSFSLVSNVMNAAAAAEAGIDAWPSDWAGVLEACTAATAAGKSFFVVAGAAAPNAGMTALNISATRVYADAPDWNAQRAAGSVTFADSQGWKDTLQAVVDMNDAGCFQGGVEGAGFEAITNGMAQGTSVAMTGPSGSAADLGQAAPDAEFLVEAFPPATASDKAFLFGSANYALSLVSASKNKDAASKFLDWAAQPEQSKTFADAQGSLPVTGLDQVDFASTFYAPVADIVTEGSFVAIPNSSWPSAAVYDALATGVQGLFTGQKSVDDVLADMDNAWG